MRVYAGLRRSMWVYAGLCGSMWIYVGGSVRVYEGLTLPQLPLNLSGSPEAHAAATASAKPLAQGDALARSSGGPDEGHTPASRVPEGGAVLGRP